jgi:hypothetical protein
MAKKAATFRLEESSLAWLSSYAEERSKSEGRKVGQGEVVEAALASFRQDCEGGVPDLPEPQTVTEVVEPAKAAARIERALAKPAPVRPHVVERPNLTRDEIRRAEEEYRAAIWARQQKLNEAKARASR